MWTMCMTEPFKGNSHFHKMGAYANHNNGPQMTKGTDKGSKSDYCWKYNKGRCKFGNNCKFAHKCSYCDGNNHGLNSCAVKAGNTGSSSAATNTNHVNNGK